MSDNNRSAFRIGEIVFYTVFVLYIALLLSQTFNLRQDTRLFPLIIMGVSGILLILKFACLLFPKVRYVLEGAGSVEGGGKKINIRNVFLVMSWIILTIVAVYLVGIIPTVLFSPLIFWIFYAKRKVWQSVLLSASLTVVIYVLFVILLRMRMYYGVLLSY